MIVFLLSGLWHGADWSFVAWGAYHGALLVLLILLNRNTKYEHGVAYERCLPSIKEFGQILLVFALATFGWMMFRADNMTQFVDYTARMCSANLLSAPYLKNRAFYVPLFASIALMFIVEWWNRDCQHGLARMTKWHSVNVLIYYALILAMYLFSVSEKVQFIYSQF